MSAQPIVCNHGGVFDEEGEGCEVCWPVEYDESSYEFECQTCDTRFLDGWTAGGFDNATLVFCSRACLANDPLLSAEEVNAAARTEPLAGNP